jgi:hypothetical protein
MNKNIQNILYMRTRAKQEQLLNAASPPPEDENIVHLEIKESEMGWGLWGLRKGSLLKINLIDENKFQIQYLEVLSNTAADENGIIKVKAKVLYT